MGPLIRTVDPFLQEEFFKEVQRELDDINSFFRARQAALSHRLHELEGEVGTQDDFSVLVRVWMAHWLVGRYAVKVAYVLYEGQPTIDKVAA